MAEFSDREIKIFSLHKHWLYADCIRVRLQPHSECKPTETSDSEEKLAELTQSPSSFSLFYSLSVWYAMLYVVAEGYKELQLTDDQIDKLLSSSEYLDALRLLRNAVFHYQEEMLPDKFWKFIQLPESAKWAQSLNSTFKAFFEKQPEIRKRLDEFQRKRSATYKSF